MDFNRYQRQTVLKDFGPEAQQKLKDSSILVVGAGGLGIPALLYLNAMGVGTIGIVEQDIVEITNLQRQVLYTESDLGRPKIEVVLERLRLQNSTSKFKTFDTFLTRNNALEIISQFDIVLDGSDNFPTRYLINDACVILKKPFVSGAIQGFEGQLSVFNYKGGPTYRCLFPNMPSLEEIPNCNDNGVLGVIPGIIGNLQALEAVKATTGVGEVLSGKLLLFNGLNQAYQTINFNLQPKNATIKKLLKSYGAELCETSPSISVAEIEQKISSGKSVQIIDVRTKTEFENFSLSQVKAVNIPLNELKGRINELDFQSPVYLLCQSGKRSEMAFRLLLEQNKQLKLFNIEGGVDRFLALHG
ncbi:HesA/MoeB/ThiF family protein [Arenibacter sp. F20364]|uniref:HesA/MoeB/ThiF family protein n=1 Tax=Arenibacter sp. F20364 TaxID=2926415 RepID=UPI001FF4C9F0|nr:HesA/MoeB/ThiF family protein [Arenibacter sp. F20364]MCK0191088.1 HesA/MoeB/ThiF family protein [Arenibacter sp. F20364]